MEQKEKEKGREERKKKEKEREKGKEERKKEEKEGKEKRRKKKKEEEKRKRKRKKKKEGEKQMGGRKATKKVGRIHVFFFILNNQELILFRGNPLSGQRNPFKGGGVIRHPFGGLGLETGKKGCHPLFEDMSFLSP